MHVSLGGGMSLVQDEGFSRQTNLEVAEKRWSEKAEQNVAFTDKK